MYITSVRDKGEENPLKPCISARATCWTCTIVSTKLVACLYLVVVVPVKAPYMVIHTYVMVSSSAVHCN